MKSLQPLIGYLLLIILFFLLGYCAGRKTQDEHTVYRDSVSTKTDTIWKDKTVVVFKDKPKPVSTLPNHGVVNTTDDSIRVYNRTEGDSLIKITVEDSVAGKLLSQKIKFDYSIPTITDSVLTLRTEVKYPLRFYIEPFVTTKPPQVPGLGVGMNLASRKYSYSARYDLLRKEYTFGIGIKIF